MICLTEGCVCPQLPLSSSHLDVYTGPGMKGPAIAMTSNSCPANLTIKREISGAELWHIMTSRGARSSPLPVNDGKCQQKKRQRSQLSLQLTTFCFYKDAEARALAKERQKKDNHNLSKSDIHAASLNLHLCCCTGTLSRWTVDCNFCSQCCFS